MNTKNSFMTTNWLLGVLYRGDVRLQFVIWTSEGAYSLCKHAQWKYANIECRPFNHESPSLFRHHFNGNVHSYMSTCTTCTYMMKTLKSKVPSADNATAIQRNAKKLTVQTNV